MFNLTTAFILQHTVEEYDSESKLLGIYATKSDAEEAIKRYQLLPGFCDFQNGFHIDEYKINHDNWSEGFVGNNTQ